MRASSLLLPTLALLAGCNAPPRTQLQRAESAYLRACSGCHGPRGDTGAAAAARLARTPADLSDRALQARLSDEELKHVIRHGRGAMPPHGANLSEQDVELIVLWVRTLPLR